MKQYQTLYPSVSQKSFPWDEPDFPTRRAAPAGSRLSVAADVSQSASEVVRHLEGFGAHVHTRPLSADFVVGPLGIGRRTGRELAASAVEGTLHTEAMMIARGFRHRLLVCEGSPGAPATCRAAWGTIQETALRAALPVLLTRSPVETAQLILWVGSAVISRKRPPRPRCVGPMRYRGTHHRRIHALEQLPNVGYMLAQHLLERFGVVRDGPLCCSDACA